MSNPDYDAAASAAKEFDTNICAECGTPLDEVPLRECSIHRAQFQREDAEGRKNLPQTKIDDLHQRIYALPDFPDEKLEIRSILSDIVALLETNFRRID
jgi:hypothetical protein